MKILFISNVFPPGFIGGYELGAFDAACELNKRGHEVAVITSDYFTDDASELVDFPVERSLACNAISHDFPIRDRAAEVKTYMDWGNIRKIDSAITRHQPDVIIAFNIAGIGSAGLQSYLRDCGLPVILYVMDNFFGEIAKDSKAYSEFKRVFGPLSLGTRSRVIAMSRNVMREIEQYIDCPRSSVSYIPGWIDTTKVPSEVRQSAEGGAKFVFCSRIAPHKGINLVLEACSQLSKSGQKDFQVDVYGSGLVTDFRQQVKFLGLNSIVTYKGSLPKEKMLDAFGNYDALVFPTWEREAYGFVVSEAAAAGCIPIMTDGIGASEWFIDGEDCLKIKRSAEALSSAMRDVIKATPAERTQRRNAAMSSAKRNLSTPRWMAELEQQCLTIAEEVEADRARPRSVAASYLGLGELWKESF